LTFQPVLLELAHDLKQNYIYILEQFDEGYKAGMLKPCQKKVEVNLGGAVWKHPNDIFLDSSYQMN
jgi:hypothetical protein